MAVPTAKYCPYRVLILVGLPGCGKSTFCNRLRDWVRISQDDLGNRKRCESFMKESLPKGHRVVIDRCNFDFAQRAHWFNIADTYAVAKSQIAVFSFRVPQEKCIANAKSRSSHPTLSASAAPNVIKKVSADLQGLHPTERAGLGLHVELNPFDPSDAEELNALFETLNMPRQESIRTKQIRGPAAVTDTDGWTTVSRKPVEAEDSTERRDVDGSAVKASIEGGSWTCSACTFINENSEGLACEVCATEKASYHH